MRLRFLGGAEMVTGSKSLLTLGNDQILIDSGMFQGPKEVEALNFENLDLEIDNISCIFLTHAHYDHCGYLPAIIKAGYNGKIICSELTKKLAQVILEDSAKIQEYNQQNKGFNKVLYTSEDVEKTISLFEVKELNQEYTHQNYSYQFYEAGHILGATSIVFTHKGKKICFSGDIGRKEDIIHSQPVFPKDIDYIVLEATYGDREHKQINPLVSLAQSVERIINTKGVLLIPTFAVARAQVIIVLLHRLFEKYPELKIPVFLDSPMGIRVTKIYEDNSDALKIDSKEFTHALRNIKKLKFGTNLKKMKRGPSIVLSSSGMLSGGKVMSYLDMYLKHEKNTVLLVGYQADETIGRRLLDGDSQISLFGHNINVRAEIKLLDSMSAHADKLELTKYIEGIGDRLKHIYLNHGELKALKSFKKHLEEKTSITIEVAQINKEITI